MRVFEAWHDTCILTKTHVALGAFVREKGLHNSCCQAHYRRRAKSTTDRPKTVVVVTAPSPPRIRTPHKLSSSPRRTQSSRRSTCNGRQSIGYIAGFPGYSLAALLGDEAAAKNSQARLETRLAAAVLRPLLLHHRCLLVLHLDG